MKKVLIIDGGRGKCWSAMKSLQLNHYEISRTEDWEEVFNSLSQGELALLLVSLDNDHTGPAKLLEFQSRNTTSPFVPLVAVSEDQNKLIEVTKLDCPHTELCQSSDGFDYIEYRIAYLLELHHFAAQQARALTEMQNRNQVLVESASEGIIQYDSTGSIQYVNPKTLKILGFEEEDILDTSVFDLLGSAEDDPEEAEELINELTRGMLQHQPYASNRVLLNTNKNSTIVAEISCNCTTDADDLVNGHIMMFNDITARTINEQRLIKLAKYDVLTGLSNRSKFHDFTEGKIAYCAHNDKKLALLFIDIDHFKNINDTMGHDAGDELLVDVAERLRNCVRETDLVARIGGDELSITLLEMGSPNQVTRIVRHILEVIAKPFQIQDREVSVSASVGISLYPESGSDLKTLTQTADTAMYQAKVDGRNTYRFFSTEIQNPEVAINTLEKINAAGVMISVDDFGTGYSSLNYLKKLPINKLKIDRSFVKDIGIDANGEAIVKAILALAHSLNLQVVAEGVEEETHVSFLREHECEQLQGYFFSRPLPVEEVTEMLRQEKVKWEATFSGVGKLPEFDPIKIKPPFH